MPKRIISIVSARPNFVKLASVHHAISAAQKKRENIEHIIIHTGQHYDPILSESFFQQLKIPPPAKNLEVKGGESNEDTVERTRRACLPALKEFKPNFVIVYGDVAGALGGALAAKEFKIPVAHVEAGLRSFDDAMPEERNRIAIDKIASLLFVTEQSGIDNLKKEGITKGVHLVGNTMIDTLTMHMLFIESQKDINFFFGMDKRPFALVTLHRPSNVDNEAILQKNLNFLEKVSQECLLVLPCHPRLKLALHPLGFSLRWPYERIELCEPRPYFAFIRMMQFCAFILTDSGGIQEEAAFLGKKCFTLRKNTERPCTLEENGGSNTLIDLEKSEDREKVLAYAKNPAPVKVQLPKEWDVRAGERIVEILLHLPQNHLQ